MTSKTPSHTDCRHLGDACKASTLRFGDELCGKSSLCTAVPVDILQFCCKTLLVECSFSIRIRTVDVVI